jgi:membrane protease subunit HflC
MKKTILVVIILVLGFLLSQSAFVVKEGTQAVVTRFGQPVGDTRHAGLNFKVPFIEQVNLFEKRILKWDGDPNQITTKEKKFIWVDATARWRIVEPLKFMKTVATLEQAQSRLDDIVDSVVRDAVSGNFLVDLVRGKDYAGEVEIELEELKLETKTSREDILDDILEKAKVNTPEFGIELIDVQIKRLNYIEKVRERVYERMISERNKVAAEYRSEGEGTKAEILGGMDKELKRIDSEAYRTSVEIKGDADAKAARIYAEAFSRDAEFYAFYRTLDSIEKVIGENSRLVMSTDSELFKYLRRSKPDLK